MTNLTNKQVKRMIETARPVAFTTVYGDTFTAIVASLYSRWSFKTADGGVYSRDDITSWHYVGKNVFDAAFINNFVFVS